MKDFLVQTFGGNIVTQYLSIFIVSMVPLIELRGAVPIAHIFSRMNPEFNLVLAYCILPTPTAKSKSTTNSFSSIAQR